MQRVALISHGQAEQVGSGIERLAAVARDAGVELVVSADEAAEVRSTITRMVMDHEGVLQMHGFYIDLECKHVSFDLIIDFSAPNRDELYNHIVAEAQSLYPGYTFQIALDRDLSD